MRSAEDEESSEEEAEGRQTDQNGSAGFSAQAEGIAGWGEGEEMRVSNTIDQGGKVALAIKGRKGGAVHFDTGAQRDALTEVPCRGTSPETTMTSFSAVYVQRANVAESSDCSLIESIDPNDAREVAVEEMSQEEKS